MSCKTKKVLLLVLATIVGSQLVAGDNTYPQYWPSEKNPTIVDYGPAHLQIYQQLKANDDAAQLAKKLKTSTAEQQRLLNKAQKKSTARAKSTKKS